MKGVGENDVQVSEGLESEKLHCMTETGTVRARERHLVHTAVVSSSQEPFHIRYRIFVASVSFVIQSSTARFFFLVSERCELQD